MMKKLFIFLLLLICNISSFAQKKIPKLSVEQIIDRYLEVTGGKERWKSVATLEINGYSISAIDSNQKNIEKNTFIKYYRKEPVCLSIIRDNVRLVESASFSKMYNYKTKEWKDLTLFSKVSNVAGVNFTFLSFSMHFANENMSRHNYSTVSDKLFGNDYDVIELIKPITANGETRIVYYLFSKDTGMLKSIRIQVNGENYTETKIEGYTDIEGFVFSTSTSYNYGPLIKSPITLHPKTSIYTEIKINQPIDESVFDMN
jgi:hypothetical protein